MSVERWLPVVGYEGLYEVSDQGRVRSLDVAQIQTGRWGTEHVQLRRGRVLQPWAKDSGYLFVSLRRERGRRSRPVHQLVLEAFVGPRPDDMPVTRHLNGDPTDNRLGNLRWGTYSENERDRVLHGTHNNAVKTHCPRNHALVAPNLLPEALRRGSRGCLSCNRARDYLRKHPEAELQEVSDRYFAEIMSPAEEAS